jgi:hypothetical protein
LKSSRGKRSKLPTLTRQSHGAEGRPLSASAPRGDVQPPSWRPPRISGGASSEGPPRGSRRPRRGPGALPSPGRVSVGRDKKAAREGREGGSEASASGVQPLGRTRLAAPTEEEDVGKARALPRGAGGSVPTPRARRTLTKRLRPTRLETRTKESNARASVVAANQHTGGPRKGPRWNAQRKRKRGIGLALAGIPPPLSAGEAPSTDPELPPSGATPGDRNERFE